jgi:hypothetical protein
MEFVIWGGLEYLYGEEKEEGTHRMLYQGWADGLGPRLLGLAESEDGVRWPKYGLSYPLWVNVEIGPSEAITPAIHCLGTQGAPRRGAST